MIGKVAEEFGEKIRVRACGLCFRGEDILLVNHSGIYGHDFWAPPGGGVQFGESIEVTLKREFREECKTDIRVGRCMFGCEFIRPPFHALELFYEVENMDEPQLGNDPELVDHQVISDLEFMSEKQMALKEREHLHGILNTVKKPAELKRLFGFFSLT
jgi:8-oxo-dGTP diphosphatase